VTAIVIRGNARVTWFTGLASVRAKACEMARRAAARAAAVVMIGAVGAQRRLPGRNPGPAGHQGVALKLPNSGAGGRERVCRSAWY
jgi:hypothetical protein